MKLKKYDMVHITWLDSVLDSDTWHFYGDYEFEDHERSMNFESVGYFLKKTKIATFICLSKKIHGSSGGENISRIKAIPNVAIQVIRRLE